MNTIHILEDHSGLMTLACSVLMLIVTIIYVYFTWRQAKYSNDSLKESIKQFRESKQPCLIPSVKKVNGVAFDAGKYLRIQFNFDYDVVNVGDSPALSVHTIATMILRYAQEGKEVMAHLMPNYKHSISAQETITSSFHFETSEFRDILEDIEISRVKNIKRIETDPRQDPYRGPALKLRIVYKNLNEQWYLTEIEQDLFEIEKILDKSKVSENEPIDRDNYEEVTNGSLNDKDVFIGRMINPAYSTMKHKLLSEKEAHMLINLPQNS